MCTINHNSNVLFSMHNKPITTQNSVFAFFSLIIINIVFTFQGAEARRLWKLIMIYYVLQRDSINFQQKFSLPSSYSCFRKMAQARWRRRCFQFVLRRQLCLPMRAQTRVTFLVYLRIKCPSFWINTWQIMMAENCDSR